MTKRIGVDPVPDDEDLVKWLNERFKSSDEEYKTIFTEFQEVVSLTRENGEPIEFAYARLLNRLATLDAPVILRALSAVIWRFSK